MSDQRDTSTVDLSGILASYRSVQVERAQKIEQTLTALRRAEYYLAIQQETVDGLRRMLAVLDGE